ncbi:cysteine ABC transporter [Pseudomonas tohonis]|uniref:Cysteine ABC transporter n=1 Tax=Pseudomonas tohonis TaxID=2725477 RepID=A0A6J4DZ30_9PSED|nr:transporter substrate-binding domain-containing protein [Pseudomonas tohonis]BCG22266.1 cysteine ABC transporter [Pseudomonas tohonis]GJN53767.1 cysteine ABC transporter [Pseudomonas tohonis]
MRLLHCLLALLPLVVAPLARADLIDDVWERGSLRIALVEDAPPYSFRQEDKLTGYEVELGHALADELNVKADFIPVPRDKLLDGLRSGNVDIVLSREAQAAREDQQLDFSEPYGKGGGRQLAGGADAGGLTQSLAPGKPAAQPDEKSEEEQAIPFRKDNPAFRSALNNALSKLKSSGRLDELSRKWLEGQAPTTDAGTPTEQPAPPPASQPQPAGDSEQY